jgi:drug/metabolite transporter (DMT)-like permease
MKFGRIEMKSNVKKYIPALGIIVVGIVLIAYSYLTKSADHPQGPPPGGARPPGHHEEEGGGIFKLLGNGAILLGALSFSWFLLKKKLKSSSNLVKTLAKKSYKFHTVFGFAGLILVVIHGCYYLFTDFSNRNTPTGIAAFLLLACLAAYGYIFNRSKNKVLKKIHYYLSYVWIVAILIHGGGFVIATAVGLLVLYFLLSYLEGKPLLKLKRTS